MNEQTKKLLREGLYWDALNRENTRREAKKLGPGSPYHEIVISIVEMEQTCRGDHEAMQLLAQARQDLMGNKYPPAKDLCDELFKKLGNEHALPVITTDNVTRAYIWQSNFRNNISNSEKITTQFVETLVDGARKLRDELNNDNLSFNLAKKAFKKSVRCLEIARHYSENQLYIDQMDKLRASILCNFGVNLINKAQEKLSSTFDGLLPNSTSAFETVCNAIDETLNEVREGIRYIDEANRLDTQNPVIQERWKEGKNIEKEILKQKEQLEEIPHRGNAMSLCNRGIERINRAQEAYQRTMDRITSDIKYGRIDIASLVRTSLIRKSDIFDTVDPEILRQLFTDPTQQEKLLKLLIPEIVEAKSQLISEIEAGIADIEEAKRQDPNNRHITEQLKTARDILKSAGGSVSTDSKTSPKPKTTKPQLSKSTSQKEKTTVKRRRIEASTKKYSTALLLSIFLGWFGADRFYLGHFWGWIKLCLLFGGVIVGELQGFEITIWFLIASGLWWLIDILLIALRKLKDKDGLILS